MKTQPYPLQKILTLPKDSTAANLVFQLASVTPLTTSSGRTSLAFSTASSIESSASVHSSRTPPPAPPPPPPPPPFKPDIYKE